MKRGLAGYLALRVPPPVVGALCALLIWVVAPAVPHVAGVSGVFVLLLAVSGVGMALASAWAFRQARTTLDPLHPERANRLVTTGIYRITRNPIYLGGLLLLVAWSLALGRLWGWGGLGCLIFVVYLQRFQIRPEEHALRQLFGVEFEHYCTQVPRWLALRIGERR